jgi:hypothetical protein
VPFTRSNLIQNSLQLVQPAFQKMLTHLRTKALEKFKTGLISSLESGKSFAASVRDNKECSLKEFEQGCAGKLHTLVVIYVQLIVKFTLYKNTRNGNLFQNHCVYMTNEGCNSH